MAKKNRNVAIVGIGQTEYSSHKEYQNQPEMINEAVRAALKDANLTLDDIDCVVHGNMELFESVYSLICGMCWAPALLANLLLDHYRWYYWCYCWCAADNLVASGMFDIVMAIGFENCRKPDYCWNNQYG